MIRKLGWSGGSGAWLSGRAFGRLLDKSGAGGLGLGAEALIHGARKQLELCLPHPHLWKEVLLQLLTLLPSCLGLCFKAFSPGAPQPHGNSSLRATSDRSQTHILTSLHRAGAPSV